jgi:hypothetical protein
MPSWLAILICLPLLGCGLSHRITQLEDEIQRLKAEQQRISDTFYFRVQSETRQLWARLNCTNQQVSEFIADCERGEMGCTEESVANALSFMSTQPHALLYLRPEVGVKGMVPVRRGQLLGLTDLKDLHTSTRYLVLTQPRTEAAEHYQEALRIGKEVVDGLRKDFGLPRMTQILGPRTLPCRLKQKLLANYIRRVDQLQTGEPAESEPRVRVWVFRTDC